MAEVIAEIVRIKNIQPIPGADNIELATVYDYPVVIKKGSFQTGDGAVYVPAGSVVPFEPVWEFIHKGAPDERHRRIRPITLRGQYSVGVLMDLADLHAAGYGNGIWNLGDNVTETLRITKYEPPVKNNEGKATDSLQVELPGFSKYTDIQDHRKYGQVMFEPGEPVFVSEKVHGRNFRCGWLSSGKNAEFVVGSHNAIRLSDADPWHVGAAVVGVKDKLALFPGYVLYGELYGPGMQKNYDYGIKSPSVLFYDVFDNATGKFLDWDPAEAFLEETGLPIVPQLFQGAYDQELVKRLATGPSTLGGKMPREGVVVRPLYERIDSRGRRVILKEINPDYAKKDQSEEH